MTGQRPGAEFFGRAARSAPQRGNTPPAATAPQFGSPSSQGPGPGNPPTAGPPPASMSPAYSASSVSTSGSSSASPGRSTSTPSGSPPLTEGVMARAKADDVRALEVLFAQFVPPGEQIVETRYMGVMGMWGIGTHSFAAVTTERVASLKIGLFGAVTYQDGSLEYINSSVIFQPSRLKLYLPAALWVLIPLILVLASWITYLGTGGLFLVGTTGTAVALLITFLVLAVVILLVPLVVRLTYRFVKSGLAIWIREGLSVLIFIDRRRITLANRLYRLCAELRDERIREIGHP